MMDSATLAALRAFPRQLAEHYQAFPAAFRHWTPPSWDGIPSERFTALEQVCHVRDIELEGYQVRFQRTLKEENPLLPGLDSERIATERSYGRADAALALADFAAARMATILIISGLNPDQLRRPAVFDGYGPTTLRGLVHFLCSHDQQHLAGLQWLLGQTSRPG